MAARSQPSTRLVENRRFPRTSVIWSGKLISEDENLDCVAMNLSANDAKLLLDRPLDEQTRSWVLTIPRLGKISAELAWSAPDGGNKIGLKFQLPPGVVAEQLAHSLSKPRKSFIEA